MSLYFFSTIQVNLSEVNPLYNVPNIFISQTNANCLVVKVVSEKLRFLRSTKPLTGLRAPLSGDRSFYKYSCAEFYFDDLQDGVLFARLHTVSDSFHNMRPVESQDVIRFHSRAGRTYSNIWKLLNETRLSFNLNVRTIYCL